MFILNRAKGDKNERKGKVLSRERRFVPRRSDAAKFLIKHFNADIKYSWASGVAVGRFLSELKNGRLIARKCNKCERILVPPRMFCEDCFRDTDEWVYVKDTGTINTYSIAHVGTDAHRLTNRSSSR